MNLYIEDPLIPGTKLKKADLDGATGKAFLKKVFLFSDGVMLSQIRDISGIDGSTLQNWTKRGWVENSVQKKYNMDQVAHILIINMLRSCIQLDHISFLIQYINGRVDDRSDDIISDTELYDAICLCIEKLDTADRCDEKTVDGVVGEVTAGYKEPLPGAKLRLCTALRIILLYYCSSLVKHHADELLSGVELR